jgi:hypothetical protein
MKCELGPCNSRELLVREVQTDNPVLTGSDQVLNQMGADKATGTQNGDAQRWRGIAIAVPKLAHVQLPERGFLLPSA